MFVAFTPHVRRQQVTGSASGGKSSGAVSVLVQPVDRRIPRIRITTRQRGALEGKRLIVAVDAWPADSK
jgi:exosome complex exonuclease DIS3/RRP44